MQRTRAHGWMAALLPAALAVAAFSCGGPPVDREATLSRLRTAMNEDLPEGDATAIENHNRIVEQVRDGNVLDGMRRAEVQEALGRGQECGTRELCTRGGFEPDDWVYEIGRRDGLPWGPTLVVGFDRQGIVEGIYTLTRR